MSIESHKAAVRRVFEEAINQRKLAIIEEVIGPEYVNRSMPAPSPGPAGLRAVLQGFIDGFPDLHIQLHNVLGEGDTVATRGEFTGTHRGAFMGVPATGKKVKVPYIDLWRFQGGKAVENWVQMDLLGLMQQLGVLPTPGK